MTCCLTGLAIPVARELLNATKQTQYASSKKPRQAGYDVNVTTDDKDWLWSFLLDFISFFGLNCESFFSLELNFIYCLLFIIP